MNVKSLRSLSLMTAVLLTGLAATGCSYFLPPGDSVYAGRSEVRRDAFGVPHVKGETIPAAVYGFAYAQAEDQIGNIMKRMLNARGELARHFGPSMVERDVFAKRFHFHDGGEGLKTMSPEVRELYVAYAEGVNAYIRENRENLPAWIEPITPGDVLGASRAALLGFAFNRDDIIGRIQAENSVPSVEAVAEVEAETRGSNMWAISPDRTDSGKAILMGNPHLPWDLTWYEGHLTVPGKYNVYGAAFVGGPVPTIAFNEALGWSHTVNYPDTEDVYVFQEDPDQADHILYDGESHALEPVEFIVEVKTENGLEEREYLFWESAFGPVIHRHDGKVWVIKSSVFDENGFVEQWYRMGLARNLEEFQAALDMNSIPMFNAIYADRDGHILYRWMARLPRRPEGQDGKGVVEVSDSSAVWSEIHPAADLPELVDPEGGYVQNSNDPPWHTTLEQLIDPADFPVYMPEPRLRLRTQHGLTLIEDTETFSLDGVIEDKHSLRMLAGERLRDDLVAAARATAEEEADVERKGELMAVASVLEEWDGTSARDSRGGTLFALWWALYTKENSSIWKEVWSAEEPMATPRGIGNPVRAVNNLLEAAKECESRFGSLDVAWGESHRLRRGALDVPMNGARSDLGSFRVINYKPADDGKEVAYGGDGWVFAVEFGETPRAYSILAYGQSENENADHATDQVERFINGELKEVHFTEEAVEANTVRRYRP